jgi:hypothetical protein
MNNTIKWLFRLGAPAVLAITVGASAKAQSAPGTPVAHNSQCSIAEQSVDDQGRKVIVTQCSGDLPGVLTLVLANPADASLSGEWALNVSYTAPLHPNAPLDPNATDPDEAVGETLIQKGVIHGTIVGGTASLVNGNVVLLNGVQLALTSGSLQFTNIVKGTGSGSVSGTSLDDRNASSTSLTLTF